MNNNTNKIQDHGHDHNHDHDHDHDQLMMGTPPLNSDGKMVIKIKIPNLEKKKKQEQEHEDDGDDDVNKMVVGKKICLECKKEFSSGKALGGHMRVHVQSSLKTKKHQNPSFFNKPKTPMFKKTDFKLTQMKVLQQDDVQNKPFYMNSVNDEGKPTCSQCGKTFPSMKSLFGHMRCHPERVWRGILPPPNIGIKPKASSSSGSPSGSGSGSSEGDGDKVVDLTKFVSGWSVKERRGRKALKVVVDDDDDDDDEEEEEEEDEVLLEAVEDLMSLANGGGGSMMESGVTQRQMKVEVYEGSNSNKIEAHSPSVNLLGKAVMEDEIGPVKMELDDGDNESDGRITIEQLMAVNCKSANTQNPNNKMKKRKKMKLMMELEPSDVAVSTLLPLLPEQQQQQPVVTECKYKCTTCDRCFPTHQALGGHRSSHNKPKLMSTDRHLIEEGDYKSLLMNMSGENSEKDLAFAGSFMLALATGCAANSSNNSNVHQCKTCDKIFPTGQALGGHQRCHWTGTSVAPAPSSQITSTGEAASQTGCDRKVLDFDLNEIPNLAMMEEYEGGNGNGYASSSYNSNMC